MDTAISFLIKLPESRTKAPTFLPEVEVSDGFAGEAAAGGASGTPFSATTSVGVGSIAKRVYDVRCNR